MYIVPLVRVFLLLHGISSLCIWKYWPKGISICLFQFRVFLVMIARGMIFSKIIAVVGKYPNRLTLFNTIFIFNITGNLMKGRICLVALHLFLPPRFIAIFQVHACWHSPSWPLANYTFPLLVLAWDQTPYWHELSWFGNHISNRRHKYFKSIWICLCIFVWKSDL